MERRTKDKVREKLRRPSEQYAVRARERTGRVGRVWEGVRHLGRGR